MTIEGRLQIDLHPDSGQHHRALIRSSRPLQASQFFEGKTPAQVLAQLPLLFSVCAVAQGRAAVSALRQALALDEDCAGDNARTLLVMMETAREHTWRILLDWPKLSGHTAASAGIVTLQPMMKAFYGALFAEGEAFSLAKTVQPDLAALSTLIDDLEQLLSDEVFAASPARWLTIDSEEGLIDWAERSRSPAAVMLRWLYEQRWQTLGSADTEFLPVLPEAWLNQRLDAADAMQFIAAPQWHGDARETTSLARQQLRSPLLQSLQARWGSGLLVRLVARLIELARLPAVMRAQLGRLELEGRGIGPARVALPEGVGIGQVEAARGRLVHRVVVVDGRVDRYQILAPTEWNFHPDGVVARSLSKLKQNDGDRLPQQAALLIQAVDPCVGYELEIH